jgi:IS5 family transposase
MKKMSFASAEYAHKKKITRREKFLAEMNALVPGAVCLWHSSRFTLK